MSVQEPDHRIGPPPIGVGLLGPLTLHVDGVEVPVAGDRRRALLALLATAGRHGVGTGRLVDELWGTAVPKDPVAALHNLVSRLRNHLGRHAHLLERRPAGYRLSECVVDSDVVRELLATASATDDPTSRVRVTARALELWRGDPLGEFTGLADLGAERVALEELRQRLDDAHVEALVDAADPTATASATALVAANPLRESATRLLIRALAADGRTAEAMSVASGFRMRLAEATGLDPSPALGALEQSVAAGDAAIPISTRLAGPAAGSPRPAPTGGPMVGRERERAEVSRLLAAHRLVTLTGTGGVGKTTLALDVAADPVVFPDHAVYVVNLAAVAREDRVAAAVTSTLGLDLDAAASPSTVARHLGTGASLLVLDNCEHLLAACRELVGEIIRFAPRVRVLATSRVVLHLPAEYVVRLQPLQVPSHAPGTVDTALRQPAIRAFVEHAGRRNPDFAVTERDLPDLVDLLGRVDGLPLGIELAARQAAVMPVAEVVGLLGRALDLATGTAGGGTARTLRVSVDVSFRLLSGPDQAVLAAVATFPGGVTVRTFESLAGHVGGVDDPLETLHRLVDSSLLVADASEGRYRLLHLIRHYLLDHLEASGMLAAAEDRFLEECVATVREIEVAWLGSGERAANRRLHAEMDNVRSARDLAAARDRIDVLVAITTSLFLVGIWRNIRELWTWAIEIAQSERLDDQAGRAAVLSAGAEAARLVGEFDLALDLAERALRLEEARPPRDGDRIDDRLLGAHAATAAVAHFRGDFPVAIRHWTWCGGHESLGPAYLASAALAASYAGDAEHAARLLATARTEIAAAAGPSQHAFLDYVQAELIAPADPASALALYRRAHELADDVGATFIVGIARVGAASCLTRVGDTPRAAEAYVVLLEAWRDSGQRTQLWTTARNAVTLLRARGRREVAELLVRAAELDPASALDPSSADATPFGTSPSEVPAPVAGLVLDADEVLEQAIGELRAIAAEMTPPDADA
ncbi:ATP-binding protein [Gordonia sp. KTR9]|uniref:ATP-binding protein n=1 Tax=Gordonia sp. KTR9 TaxID=337191 RepID=UPI00027DDC7E|nr:BTAD domain-containing putative transcriptional regulator [Gordonia sp. KTR9]AFR48237.1 putative ATPase [Gordonia sp. KTR9]